MATTDTTPAAPAQSAKAAAPSPGRERMTRQRGPGEPEAPPLPGQPDLSKPRNTIPEDVRKLLERLSKPLDGAPAVPDAQSLPGTEDRDAALLDYLLTP